MKVIKLYLSNHPEKAKLKNKKYDVHFLKTFYNEPIEKSQDITRMLNKIFGKKVRSRKLDVKEYVPYKQIFGCY